MKKISYLLAFVLVAAFSLCAFTACNEKETETVYAANEAICADSYENYADTVFLNTEKYPWLAERGQGLYWITGYEDTTSEGRRLYGGEPKDVKADSEEGKKFFDPNKPTFIIVHGVQFGKGRAGKYSQCWSDKAYGSQLTGKDTGFDWTGIFDDGKVPTKFEMTQILFEKGYNVGIFNWQTMCESDGVSIGGMNVTMGLIPVEENVVCGGVQAMNTDGKFTDRDAIHGYSVAEFFVAEYMRAMQGRNDYNKDIIVAGHSMGGFLSCVGCSMLTEMAKKGYLEKGCVPTRVCLQDPYMGWGEVSDYEGKVVSWTKNPVIGNSMRHIYLASMENLVIGNDILVEQMCASNLIASYLAGIFLTREDGFVVGETSDDAGYFIVQQLTVYSEVAPNYPNMQDFSAHVPTRDYSMLTAAAPAKIVKTADGKDINVPLFSLSTEKMRELRGYMFKQTSGGETMYPSDDEYTVTDNRFGEYEIKYGKKITRTKA